MEGLLAAGVRFFKVYLCHDTLSRKMYSGLLRVLSTLSCKTDHNTRCSLQCRTSSHGLSTSQKSAGLQVCRSASLQVCKSASLQVCKSASLQSASVAHRTNIKKVQMVLLLHSAFILCFHVTSLLSKTKNYESFCSSSFMRCKIL